MAVKVTFDRAHLAARFRKGKETCGQGTAEQILQDCNLYSVPDDGEHTLKDSGRVEQIGDEYAATWNTVYAAFQFYGCWPDGSHAVKNHTQGYSLHPSIMWTEAAKKAYCKDWNIVAQREFVKGADG